MRACGAGGKAGLSNCVFTADTHTAGATTLLLQAALPCAMLGRPNETTMVLRGGTNVSFSPPVDFIEYVLLPLLTRFFQVLHTSLSVGDWVVRRRPVLCS